MLVFGDRCLAFRDAWIGWRGVDAVGGYLIAFCVMWIVFCDVCCVFCVMWCVVDGVWCYVWGITFCVVFCV